MKKYLFLISGLIATGAANAAEGGSSDIVTQLVGAVDTSMLVGTVTSLGLVAVSVKWGEKGITFVKRLIGKF